MKRSTPRNQVLKHFLDLQPADLNNRRTLYRLYLTAVFAGIWKNSDSSDVLDFMALAVKAVRDDTQGTPGVLFWHLLINNARDRITDAHERTVLLRWSSQDRYDLYEDTCAQNNAHGTVHTQIPPLTYDPDYEQLRGYHHSFLLQCPFPQKTLPANTDLWRSQHGRRLMIVRAGYSVVDGDIISRAIPSGAIPRIVLPYIFAQAIRYGRYVCMGRTLHQFMKDTGFSTGARNYQAIKEQTFNLACSTISLHEIVQGRRGADIYATASVPIASKMRLDPEELTIRPENEVTDLSDPQHWESNIIISPPLFDLITENPVPAQHRTPCAADALTAPHGSVLLAVLPHVLRT